MTLDPGHFHAALVQKYMYDQVSPEVYVYAPEGKDVKDHLERIRRYNTREDNPTEWEAIVYTGPDYLEKMLEQKPGNVMVVSGNNAKKTEYIKKAVSAGINVLADKPMVISHEKFPDLVKSFEIAPENNVLLYDIMTERYEITTILQKELSLIPGVFGDQLQGTADQPGITKESVHHFFKYVSGSPLTRPAWFFDVSQQGEGMVDVSTHLVDMVQWECFPESIIDYREDIEMVDARHWTTDITLDQFKKVTGHDSYPEYLLKDVENGILKVYSNGEMIYRIKDVFARVSVTWEYQAPEGAGDTHHSMMRGSKCNLIINQGEEENYKPELYIEPVTGLASFEEAIEKAVEETLQHKYPGIGLEKLSGNKWKVLIPEKYRIGHEAHFSQVTEKYLEYLTRGNMPEWEVPNMLAKYYVTTQALKMARMKHR